ncbi:putative mucin/carbohydrate-binding domain-containing protein [Clostridium frigidicarnis]|uniref:Carbohydrate binding domain-containing protein n=1 Tax=Clostridium frigidicarnis TaxID=84698 RepID=A0A1I0XE29_9CLOT|nr:putative mucin/carbohydrate-binding domain-containing protein [Clostridium frigidicarnis]SFA98686.1 Carbohydrate binding domain-containing protein [Clostridium frigidicarnis]
MKRFSKFLILQLFFMCAICGSAINVYADEVKQKELYTLEDPTWLRKTDFSKGLGHDRQDLGIILPANTQFTIRQTNPNFKGNLKLKLYNDNNQHEISKEFNQTSITVSNPYNSVPFVDTIYGGTEKPKVEYTVTSNMQTLPTYRKGDNEQTFFTQWDKTAAPFALVVDNDFQLLVPQKDKAYMKNMRDFASIDQLILYYRDIFSYYNKLTGISFDTNVKTDKNIPNKYFMKADKSGPGGAYYGGDHTAETSDSVAGFWLSKGWGALHEIGHGYQDTFNHGEVWNNIYAHSFQKKDPDVNIYTNGWLYDYGRKSTVDYTVNKLWHQNKSAFNTWGLREQLYGHVLLKDKAGEDSFAHLNQEGRKLANTIGFNKSDYKQFDLISKYYGEISKLDFTPVIESFGGEMTSWQKEQNRYKNYKPVAPLNEVVPDSQVGQIQQSLKLETPLSLVTTDDLATTGLKGNVTLNFKIDDFNQIKNQTLYLMNGEKEVKKITITDPSLSLGQLPVGIYTIYTTNTDDKSYTLDTHYLRVKDATNNVSLNYSLRAKSSLVNQEIDFLGISDNLFATATVDLENQRLNIKVNNKDPHFYFPSDKYPFYAKIEILDQNNNVTYTRLITGTNEKLETSSQILKEGYKIRINHLEPSRLKIRDNKTALNNVKTNTLLVTNQGLKNEILNQNLNQELAQRIDAFASKIYAEQLMAKSDCAESKIELKLAIDALVEPLKTQMLTKYKDLLPKPTTNKENPNEGSAFTFDFKGYSDKQFAKLDLDLKNLTSKLTVENIKTHYYFNDSYASILIQDEKGQTIFDKDFIGNEVNDALTKDIPLKEGYYLTVKHREFKGRLFITNENNNLLLDINSVNSYKISKNELKSIDPGTIPKPNNNAYVGKNFKFTFKGAEEWLFAELNLDLSSNQAKIDIKNGDAHYLVTDSYASILIRDAEGNTVYTKDFIGNKVNQASIQNISIKPNYYITIKHKEPNINNRLLITNTDNKLELDKDKSITYKITDTGLVKSSEDEIKKLPLKYVVNFDDTKTITSDLQITGECVSGNKVTNIEINVNGAKYAAERSMLSDPQNKYAGYDLSQGAFKIDLNWSNWSDNPYSYKIIVTTEDGQKTTIKEGTLIVKKQSGGTEQINEWKPGTSYKPGNIVTYNGYKYKCIQAHTAIYSWEPKVTPALWGRIA